MNWVILRLSYINYERFGSSWMARSSDISKNGREAASVEEPLKERDQGSGGRAGRLPVAQNLATPRASTRPLVRARSSAGEHYVDIVGVTGSIPVAPTIFRVLSQGVVRQLSR